MLSTERFPDRRQIWPGAMLGAIAHAIFVCRHPELSNEQSWDGANYNVQDSAGSRGTIAFSGEKLVGAFFCESCDRNPFHFNASYSLNRFFAGLPKDLLPLAHDEALQYLLQEFNGATVPVITSAFWGDETSEQLQAAEPWERVFDNGGALVMNQLLKPDLAIARWKTEYDLTPSEAKLVMALFDRKIANPDNSIEFNESERYLWTIIAQGQEGADSSRESFAEIGIILPA